MTDTENLPELHTGWCWTTIGEISELNPKIQNSEISNDTEVSFLPMKCVQEQNGIFDLSITKKYSEVKKGYTSFVDGDIIFAKITPCMENGKVAVINNLKNGLGFGSTEFHVIRLLNEEIVKKFIFFFIVREEFRRDAKRKMTGSAGQLRVPTTYLQETKIPLPPLIEQHRIVQKIEELFTDLDVGVQVLEKAKVQVKNYRQAVLKAAVEGKLTEEWRTQNPDVESADLLLNRIEEKVMKFQVNQKRKIKKLQSFDNNFPLLPEGWALTRLYCIADIKGGVTKDCNKIVENGREIPYLRVANVQRGYLDLSEIKHIVASESVISELNLKYGDILFTEGGDRDKLGRGWIWQNELPVCIHQNHIFRARLYSEEISSKFISWFANIHHQYFMNVGKQTTNLASINLTKLSEFPVSLPPTEEQKVIVSEIERRFSVIDQIEKIIDQSLIQAEKLRQSILKKAFKGKLVPQNPNEEPASILLEKIKQERVKQEKGRSEIQKKPGKKDKVKAETIMEVSGKTKQAELF